MGPPVISVVIPCRGHAEELQSCLAALKRQVGCPPHGVIVVNSAADPAVAAVVAEFPDVRSISDPSGLYPGAARNRGAQEASGEYVAFIDADCIPEPAWLATTFAALTTGITVVTGAVLDARPFHPIAASDNLLQYVDFSPRRPDGPVSRISTSNFAIRRVAFVALGGFVSDWPVGEDALFSRAAAARWPDGIRFVSAMRVRHVGRTTLLSFWKHQWRFGFYRGRMGLTLRRPIYQTWGRSTVFIIPTICVRLTYVVRKVARWDPARLPRLLLVLPVMISGLVPWAAGFRRGCRAALAGSRKDVAE